jgi:CheY-like chemotaxis protein
MEDGQRIRVDLFDCACFRCYNARNFETQGGSDTMNADSPLHGKKILVVDDEPDILQTVAELLEMCDVDQAPDYDTAVQLLSSHTYDIVVLDIMGVNGFELLKQADSRGFPAVMLTAHSVTTEALKKSINLGASSFIPKDKMTELRELLEEVILGGGKRLWWQKSMDRLGDYFDGRFGADWKEKDAFFKDFTESLRKGGQEKS